MRTLPSTSQLPLTLLFLLCLVSPTAAQSPPTSPQPQADDVATVESETQASPHNTKDSDPLAASSSIAELDEVQTFANAIADVVPEQRDRASLLATDVASLTQYRAHQTPIVTQAEHLRLSSEALPIESFLDAALLAQSDSPESDAPESEVAQADSSETTSRPGFLTGSATLASNYLTRGISQTGSRPAIQGNLQYNQPLADDLTLYGGFLTSSVNFGGSTGPDIEFDWYAGAHYQINDRLSANVISYYFTYLGNSDGFDYDWWEIFPSLTYDFGPFSLTGELGYSPNWFFETGDGLHLDAIVNIPINENFFVSTSLLHQAVENNTRLGLPDWYSWNLTVGYTRDNYTLSLSFSDTDIAQANCLGGQDVCDPLVWVSLTRSW